MTVEEKVAQISTAYSLVPARSPATLESKMPDEVNSLGFLFWRRPIDSFAKVPFRLLAARASLIVSIRRKLMVDPPSARLRRDKGVESWENCG